MFCAYTRPRYQMSVYRTIGPLVFRSFQTNRPEQALNTQKFRLISGIFWVSEEFRSALVLLQSKDYCNNQD